MSMEYVYLYTLINIILFVGMQLHVTNVQEYGKYHYFNLHCHC